MPKWKSYCFGITKLQTHEREICSELHFTFSQESESGRFQSPKKYLKSVQQFYTFFMLNVFNHFLTMSAPKKKRASGSRLKSILDFSTPGLFAIGYDVLGQSGRSLVKKAISEQPSSHGVRVKAQPLKLERAEDARDRRLRSLRKVCVICHCPSTHPRVQSLSPSVVRDRPSATSSLYPTWQEVICLRGRTQARRYVIEDGVSFDGAKETVLSYMDCQSSTFCQSFRGY